MRSSEQRGYSHFRKTRKFYMPGNHQDMDDSYSSIDEGEEKAEDNDSDLSSDENAIRSLDFGACFSLSSLSVCEFSSPNNSSSEIDLIIDSIDLSDKILSVSSIHHSKEKSKDNDSDLFSDEQVERRFASIFSSDHTASELSNSEGKRSEAEVVPGRMDLNGASSFSQLSNDISFNKIIPLNIFNTDNINIKVTSENIYNFSDLVALFTPISSNIVRYVGGPEKHHNGEKARIFSINELDKLLQISKGDEDCLDIYAGLTPVRHAKRIDGKRVFGEEGTPTKFNTIASHKDLAGTGFCFSPGNTYFDSQRRAKIISNKSGGFYPDFSTIQDTLLDYKQYGIPFAETIYIEKAANGVERRYEFDRGFLLSCIEWLEAQPLRDVMDMANSSPLKKNERTDSKETKASLLSKTPNRNKRAANFISPNVLLAESKKANDSVQKKQKQEGLLSVFSSPSSGRTSSLGFFGINSLADTTVNSNNINNSHIFNDSRHTSISTSSNSTNNVNRSTERKEIIKKDRIKTLRF